jgi:nucleoside-diphosphate-sugar epimerase
VPSGTTLITGAAGWTARPILDRLGGAAPPLICLDVEQPADGQLQGLRWIQADVGDFGAVEAAISPDVTAVVHLAVAVGESNYAQPETAFRTNVLGTYNVFEVARRNAVRRVVLISSAPVHLPSATIRSATEWKSDAGEGHLYDLTKRLQEEIARDYAATFRMDAIVLRAGHVVDARERRDPHGRDLEQLAYCRGGWVCRHDLAAAVARSLDAPLSGFHLFSIVGAGSARRRFDVERAEDQLGFTIEARFEEYEPSS